MSIADKPLLQIREAGFKGGSRNKSVIAVKDHDILSNEILVNFLIMLLCLDSGVAICTEYRYTKLNGKGVTMRQP